MDKIDGPYYLFPTIRRLATLPSWMRIAGPYLGSTNVVPVDFLAAAVAHLIPATGLDGRAFHLVNAKPQAVTPVFNAFARAAGAPRIAPVIDRCLLGPVAALGGQVTNLPGAELVRDVVLARLEIP